MVMTEERRSPPAQARASVPISPSNPDRLQNGQLRQFVITAPAPCPYLPGRLEQKLVTTIDVDDPEAYNQLHGVGFRRSHEMAYRPVCPTCDDCKSLRIDVERFTFNRTQKKLMRRHAQLMRLVADNGATQESYELFHSYTKSRHPDGEMASMGPSDFASLIHETAVDTHVIEWHDVNNPVGQSLAAACITDILRDGVSMVYSYYDVQAKTASYGTFMILSLIEVCRRLELPYLYLGYWVEGSPSMDYKSRFQPAEIYSDQGWHALSKS